MLQIYLLNCPDAATDIRPPFFAILAAQEDPLDAFEDPITGRCKSSDNSIYRYLKKRLERAGNFDIESDVETCASWCISSRGIGFVGMSVRHEHMLGAHHLAADCYCYYSADSTVPDLPADGLSRVDSSNYSGTGAVGGANNWSRWRCYAVQEYASVAACQEYESLACLRYAITTAEASVVTTQDAIATLEGTIATLEGTVATAQGTITTSQETITTHQASVTTSQETITTLETRVAVLENAIAVLGHAPVNQQEQEQSIELVAAYKFTDDLGHIGRCNNEGGVAYNLWWISLRFHGGDFDNSMENVRGCGSGCLSFRAPGFVGFQFNESNCMCLYSAGSISLSDRFSDFAPTGWTIDMNGNAEGPIARMDPNASFITCYRVKDYIRWHSPRGLELVK